MGNIFKCDETMPASGAEICVGPRLAAQERDRGMADVSGSQRNSTMSTRNVDRPRRGHEVMK